MAIKEKSDLRVEALEKQFQKLFLENKKYKTKIKNYFCKTRV